MIYHILVKICGKFLGFTFFLLNQKHGFDYTDERNCVGWEKCLNVFCEIFYSSHNITVQFKSLQLIHIDTHWWNIANELSVNMTIICFLVIPFCSNTYTAVCILIMVFVFVWLQFWIYLLSLSILVLIDFDKLGMD